jgi:hypothetical protein
MLPVVAKFATTATDGKSYKVEHYNLDVVISVGYRVKSAKGVQFRITHAVFARSSNSTLTSTAGSTPPISIKAFTESHDRFLIIDQNELYHLGASLKDLGKKWFAFSKLDLPVEVILSRLPE